MNRTKNAGEKIMYTLKLFVNIFATRVTLLFKRPDIRTRIPSVRTSRWRALRFARSSSGAYRAKNLGANGSTRTRHR